MSRIDYSKWDKIDCSSSEEEEDVEPSGVAKPRVTRLDAPSRVTRTAEGDLVVEEQQPQQETAATDAIAFTHATTKPTATTTSNTTSAPQRIENWTENGAKVTTATSGLPLYWSQDRYSVTLRLELPSNATTTFTTTTAIKGKDIRVDLQGAFSYQERHSAVGNDRVASLRVTWTDPSAPNNTPPNELLEGEFPHPIHTPEDRSSSSDKDDDHQLLLDWTIDRVTEHDAQSINNNNTTVSSKLEKAYWVMTIPKAVPMEGVVIWWRRPLMQCAEIESSQANPNGSNQKARAFQESWDEAHRQFREKAKEKHSI